MEEVPLKLVLIQLDDGSCVYFGETNSALTVPNKTLLHDLKENSFPTHSDSCVLGTQVNFESGKSWFEFLFLISVCRRPEPGWYHAIKMTTQLVFAQAC